MRRRSNPESWNIWSDIAKLTNFRHFLEFRAWKKAIIHIKLANNQWFSWLCGWFCLSNLLEFGLMSDLNKKWTVPSGDVVLISKGSAAWTSAKVNGYETKCGRSRWHFINDRQLWVVWTPSKMTAQFRFSRYFITSICNLVTYRLNWQDDLTAVLNHCCENIVQVIRELNDAMRTILWRLTRIISWIMYPYWSHKNDKLTLLKSLRNYSMGNWLIRWWPIIQ